MTEEKKDTEQTIKDAAKKVFLINGLKGARMQAIANEAGINRAMLHYYFRTKDKLFEVIFSEAMAEMNQRIGGISTSDLPILKKIEHLVYGYMESASSNPEFDLFIINEFRQNPSYFDEMMKTSNAGTVMKTFVQEINKAVEKKEILGDPSQIFLSIISLCIFPFAAKTMVRTMLGHSEKEYTKLLQERKAFLVNFIIKGITT